MIMMNIYLNVDDNYLKYASVMLFSLRENNPHTEINVYILFTDINEVNWNQFKIYLKELNIELFPVKIERDFFIEFPDTGRWSLETYFRLMIPMVTDCSMERCLYLDADIIVDGSISELYDMSFSGKSLVVGKDTVVMRDKRNEVVFNAGVMLLNLCDIKKDYSFDRISSMIVNNPEKYPMLDQDILNDIYKERVKYFDSGIFNRQVNCYDVNARRNSIIYHYSISPKPWIADGENEYFRLWWEYANRCEYFISHV